MAASSREWLETNGLGGYASATATGMNTRRYHGLLVTATKPSAGRIVLLSKLEETLLLGEQRIDLSTNQFPDAIHPKGFELLKEFRIHPFPTWVFEAEGFTLEKSLFMVHGENTTAVAYTLKRGPRGTKLEVRPLVAFRDSHALTHENGDLNRSVEIAEGRATITPYAGLPSLHVAHDGQTELAGDWYRSFEYEEERARGFDFTEDLYHPFSLEFDLATRGTATVIASTEPKRSSDIHLLRKNELTRREKLTVQSGNPSLRALARAADQFLVAREGLPTVIAGYHWFCDWGRDTMIALPGLTLATGRIEAAKGILAGFAKTVDRGMLPNRFPDAGEEPEYNAVDATLWFFEAARHVHEATRDDSFVGTVLYDLLKNILDWHERGTRHGIRVDTDGLLLSGEEGVQLTWMDAKVGDWVVTPRCGKPVEIQALWYNALKIMELFARRFRKDADAARFSAMSARAAASFGKLFWNETAGCLYDVVDGSARDGSIRPNQVLAISLAFTMLDKVRATRVLEVVTRELLTPMGLRTLSPKDPGYRGRYEGDEKSRDGAYHQGTVWPWLIGPYVSAYLRVNGRTGRAKTEAAALLQPLLDFLIGPGLGQLPEIFDGDEPRHPRGCIAQAWSVAEVLRVLAELEMARC